MVLRRWFWLISLVALTGISYLLASGLSALIGSAVLGTPPVTIEPSSGLPHRPFGSTATHRRRDSHSILSRNIFDSVVGSLVGGPPVASSDVAVDPNAEPPRCGSDFRLVSTMVSDNPDWSFAAIAAGGHTMLYRVGANVNGSEVKRITWRYAFLQPTGGQQCYVGMFVPPEEAGGPSIATASTTVAPPSYMGGPAGSATGNPELDAAVEAGVQKVSESEYNVDRSLVDRLLENQASLMRTARILPHEENGAVVGFKIYGVRRNSLLGKIGLQNGDIIHTINSFDMTSPDKALEAYARLRNADHLTVSVTRRGQRLNMDYNIR